MIIGDFYVEDLFFRAKRGIEKDTGSPDERPPRSRFRCLIGVMVACLIMTARASRECDIKGFSNGNWGWISDVAETKNDYSGGFGFRDGVGVGSKMNNSVVIAVKA